MKPATTVTTRTDRFGVQAALILFGSVVLGLAHNALNPAGLTSKKQSQNEPALELKVATGVYAVEMILARPVSSSDSEPSKFIQPVATGAAPAPASTPSPASTPAKPRMQGSASQTTWEKARPLVDSGQVVLIDSRPRLSYEAGHIPKAVNLPENEFGTAIKAFFSQYPPATTRLLIYCSNANCGSSGKLASLLSQTYGYQDVQYMPGGYLEWLQSQKSSK